MFKLFKCKNKINPEYIKPGTKIMYQGRILTISDSYPSKEHGFMYVTTVGTTLYRNEFDII